jgi:hypothetical protein
MSFLAYRRSAAAGFLQAAVVAGCVVGMGLGHVSRFEIRSAPSKCIIPWNDFELDG